MPKKVVAVTNVMHNGEFTTAGTPIDVSKFTQEELEMLHDSGAVELSGPEGPDTALPPHPPKAEEPVKEPVKATEVKK